MENQILTIHGELTDLNAYIKALNSSRWGGNTIKQVETDRVCKEAKKQKIMKVDAAKYPLIIAYTWFCKDMRKDTDNVAFAKKFINDGLVAAGVIENDSRKFVRGFTDSFEIDKTNPRVEVKIQ